MISIISNSGHVAHGIKEFVLDTQNDLENLPVDVQAGSKAYIIETGMSYILNSQGEWSQDMSASGNGSGAPGAPGKDGKSAYEIAVDNGFSGTEAEWLLSLKGETGATGPKGDTGETGPKGDKGDSPTTEELNILIAAAVDKKLFGGKAATVSSTEDLNKVLNNEEPEVKITLNDNLNLSESLIIPEGKKVTLKLGDNEITNTGTALVASGGELVLEGGTIQSVNSTIVAQDGGTITVNGTTIVSTSGNGIGATGEGSTVVIEDANITAQEYGVNVTKGASITINDGNIQGLDNFAVGGNGTPGWAACNVTINGGHFEGHITSPGYIATAVYWPGAGTLTINDGEFISDGAGIVQRGGTVILNGGSIVANGASGVLGKAGDSKITVGPYAVIFDKKAAYPYSSDMSLTIGENMQLQGTDGDVTALMPDGQTIEDANITDLREEKQVEP